MSWLKDKLFPYPIVEYPTLVSGVIEGPIRCESLDGSEMYLPAREGLITKLEPFMADDGKKYAVTHLQKKSKKGWLNMSPYIYHQWGWVVMQKQGDHGNWIPGSEKGFYVRSPGWRWDVAGTLGKHWILSKGYAGAHWD